MKTPALTPQDALILVDVQVDFCPGGRLPVPEGDRVVPVLNAWIRAARKGKAVIVASRDWHPANHVSFREQGGQWPAHCVQESAGAAFHPGLEVDEDALLVSKGDQQELDQYSDFEGTRLDETLRALGVRRLFIGGLAQDVCVLATVLGAIRHGFEAHVITGGSRPLNETSGRKALEEMLGAGAILEE